MERHTITNAKRIVVKIGTNSILNQENQLAYQRIDRLAYTLSTLTQQDKDIIFVTSGAMGVGSAELNIKIRPTNIPDQQAVSAVGQVALMSVYNRFFSYYNQHIAQVLLTRDIIDFPESLRNAKNSLSRLLEKNIIPVINENDVVAVDELDHNTRFGDNDTLSALVAEMLDADLLILLTDVDGFYSANPIDDPTAVKFDIISDVDHKILGMAGEAGTAFSTGGMRTKLQAAKRMLANDAAMVIMDATEPAQIFDLLAGEPIGTAFIKD